MSNPRSTGLALLLVGVLVLMGNTLDVLPPEAFWAGLLTYPIGGYLFFRGSRQAIERAELRTARRLNPRLGNSAGEEHARRQASHTVNPNAPQNLPDDLPGVEPAPSPQLAMADQPLLNEIQMDGKDKPDDFRVGTDVSYPVEIQERSSLADQLEKLSKLQQQGIISTEELAVAKAKLLR